LKLETDLEQDYLIEDIDKLINLDEFKNAGAGDLSILVANQYQIIKEKFKLRYGG